jgi:medium-chain acyl-[acyl-carrier-protein] hydrolase
MTSGLPTAARVDLAQSWFVPIAGGSEASMRMLCFPHAGGGSATFAPWRDRFGEQFEVLAARLPGRESRIDEEPFTDFAALLEALVGAVVPAYGDKPLVLFGQSVGALVAFALAGALTRGAADVRCLYVSSQMAPHLTQAPSLHREPQAAFLDHLRAIGGTDDLVLAQTEYLELVEPAIRADFAVAASFTYTHHRALTIPVLAFGGRNDAYLPAAAVEAWQEVSSGPCRVIWHEGTHFPTPAQWDEMAHAIMADAAGVLTTGVA